MQSETIIFSVFKLKYRKLINYMGGICIDQLTEAVTHLVTDSVRSKKYEVKLIVLIRT